jgi:hypothetical protein
MSNWRPVFPSAPKNIQYNGVSQSSLDGMPGSCCWPSDPSLFRRAFGIGGHRPVRPAILRNKSLSAITSSSAY